MEALHFKKIHIQLVQFPSIHLSFLKGTCSILITTFRPKHPSAWTILNPEKEMATEEIHSGNGTEKRDLSKKNEPFLQIYSLKLKLVKVFTGFPGGWWPSCDHVRPLDFIGILFPIFLGINIFHLHYLALVAPTSDQPYATAAHWHRGTSKGLTAAAPRNHESG